MTTPISTSFIANDLDMLAEFDGHVAILIGADKKLGDAARRVNRLTKGGVARFLYRDGFAKMD